MSFIIFMNSESSQLVFKLGFNRIIIVSEIISLMSLVSV